MKAWHAFLLASLARAALICYGEWQDRHMEVKYTDIDYVVFSDAARFVTEGQSPYERATYRYTPLLAYILVPNIYFGQAFGKWLFAVTDIFIGFLLYNYLLPLVLRPAPARSVESTQVLSSGKDTALFYTALWLFNPIVVNVSTRGNAEAIISALVLVALYFIFTRRILLGAVVYGLAVHFKIYPIIFAPTLWFLLAWTQCEGHIASRHFSSRAFIRNLFSRQSLLFAGVSLVTVVLLAALFYGLYGYQFLFETYLYHIVRTDPRHNFSLYFYQMYLGSYSPAGSASFSRLLGLAAFVPQFALLLALSVKYHQGPRASTFGVFAQTLAFVAFNKVCTVQYFVWYFSLLPLALAGCHNNTLFAFGESWRGMLVRRLGFMFCVWQGAQAAWLYSAYWLEIAGHNTFFQVWLAGIAFFAANIYVLDRFITMFDSLRDTRRSGTPEKEQ